MQNNYQCNERFDPGLSQFQDYLLESDHPLVDSYIVSSYHEDLLAHTAPLDFQVDWLIDYGLTSMKPFKDYTRLHWSIIL